jgi:hypothetical protein
MKCYYHHDRDAVALCFWCNRGLCPACACEVGDRLACRDRCEAAVERAIRIGEESSRMVEQSEPANLVVRFVNFGLTAFVLIAGLLVSALGYTRWSDAPAILLMGGVLIVFGLVLGVASWRLPG